MVIYSSLFVWRRLRWLRCRRRRPRFFCFIFRLNRIDFRPGWNGTLSNWKISLPQTKWRTLSSYFWLCFCLLFFCLVKISIFSGPLFVPCRPQWCRGHFHIHIGYLAEGCTFFPQRVTYLHNDSARYPSLKNLFASFVWDFLRFLCNLFLFFLHVLLFHNIRTSFNTISTYTCHTKHTSEHTSCIYNYMQYAYFHIATSPSCNSSQTHHAFTYFPTCSSYDEEPLHFHISPFIFILKYTIEHTYNRQGFETILCVSRTLLVKKWKRASNRICEELTLCWDYSATSNEIANYKYSATTRSIERRKMFKKKHQQVTCVLACECKHWTFQYCAALGAPTTMKSN